MAGSELTQSSHGFSVICHSDLGGCGDGMQVMREGDALYVGHWGISGMGTTILDVSDARNPRLVDQWPAPPATHTHKVQSADGLLVTNEEIFRGEGHKAGMPVYDVSDPLAPKRIGRWDSGGMGVHRIVWSGGRYAHMSATPAGARDRVWVIVDLIDPEHPVEAGRYELDEPEPEGKRYAAHHALIDEETKTAYLGYTSAGMVVLDVSDLTAPRKLSRLDWQPGDRTHTCMPLSGRGLVVVTDEQTRDGPGSPSPEGPARFKRKPEAAETRLVRVIDVSDRLAPRVAAICPEPEGDFRERALRFGPHNLHENRKGSYRSATLVFATYFNAGVRAYDVTDPAAPVEVGHWLPSPPPGQQQPQSNDLFVEASGRTWVTDRHTGGVYGIDPDERMRELMDAHRLPD